jgi:hypothetical protein
LLITLLVPRVQVIFMDQGPIWTFSLIWADQSIHIYKWFPYLRAQIDLEIQ